MELRFQKTQIDQFQRPRGSFIQSCCRVFWKVSTSLVDLIFFELMLHLSHVKQTCTKIILQAFELILGVQIAREMEDFVGDSTLKSPTQIFFALQMYLPYRIWPFSWLHTVKLIQVVFRGTALKQLQSPEHNPDFPSDLYSLKEFGTHPIDFHAPAKDLGLGFFSITGSS